MSKQPTLHLWIALLTGAVMPLAFSPYEQAWLAIPALAVFLWLACQGTPFRIGYAFGFGWFGFGAWWLAPTLHTFGHLPWVVAIFCVALVGCIMAFLPALWAWLAIKTGGRSHWLLLTFPAAAVAEEWLRGHIFTGLPWTALGNLMLNTPAVGWASWFGVYGLSLLPALLAASLLLIVSHRKMRWGSAGVIATVVLVLFAPQPYEVTGDKVYRASLIQGNIPQDRKWDAAFLHETMSRYAALSASVAERSDVIVWPEAAVPFFLERAPHWDGWLNEKINSWNRPLIFGGLKLTGSSTANNGLYSAEPHRTERSFAGKQHLVPFGEYVPAWIPFLKAVVPAIANFRPAEDAGIVKAGSINYGSLICYESLFPEQARSRVEQGATVLVNVTNDAWYGTTPAAWQHFQAARMRAVESGRYVLRAANTGVTAIISPDGKVVDRAQWWTTTALTGEFSLSEAITPYVRWGDYPLLSLLILLAIPLVSGRSGRRVYE